MISSTRRLSRRFRDVVQRQVDAGVSSVSDGEMSKVGFANYISERLAGFGGTMEPRPDDLDMRNFPIWAAKRPMFLRRPACDGPVSWKDFSAVEKDLENLTAAVAASGAPEGFMTAVSPGTLANFFPNRYYPDRATYLNVIVETMRREYEAIVNAGFVLRDRLTGPRAARHVVPR